MSETDKPDPNMLVLQLLHGILAKTAEQNILLQALLSQQQNTLRQTQAWKTVNQVLSKQYGDAARIANKLMHGMMGEVANALEELDEDPSYDTDYQFTEFLDRYGPRVQQLGVVLQMLSNLGT